MKAGAEQLRKLCRDILGAQGVGAAVAERDGPFGDYSQAPAGEKPDPENVIEP